MSNASQQNLVAFAVLNAIERRVEEMKKEMTCKVCLTNPVQRAFRGCGHLCACADCIKQLRECPICRSPVDRGVIVVNLPKTKKRMTVDHELFLKRNNYFGLDCLAGNPTAVRWVMYFPWWFLFIQSRLIRIWWYRGALLHQYCLITAH